MVLSGHLMAALLQTRAICCRSARLILNGKGKGRCDRSSFTDVVRIKSLHRRSPPFSSPPHDPVITG